MNPIDDFRSDTVTRPTPEMLDAMASAQVGDDVLGDDPTVIELENEVAAMAGMEAGVFVPSGTMGNQMAIATWTTPGDAVIAEEDSHVFFYEGGAPALFAGVMSRGIASERGVLDLDEVRKRITKKSFVTPGSTLLCIENTHNRAGGTLTSLGQMAALSGLAHESGMKVHLDGARAWNAHVALGVTLAELTSTVDSVTLCLSKGLGAPVGSVLCGGGEFIAEARNWRKRFGGGMRQAGILAAAGQVAVRTMVDRLAEDHDRSKRLGAALQGVSGIRVWTDRIESNMVMVETPGPAVEWMNRLRELGVWTMLPAERRIRLVLHHHITDKSLERCVTGFKTVARQLVR
ncbi:MAG: aminotransferase class I/II-fold pyridoxal phosphate-dependent enzyme [Chthonomonas sp.]|nr:aminotransferase class I/II-fold pyridoxal phosphate-dependent enzyme [Chthonomonas sp.]